MKIEEMEVKELKVIAYDIMLSIQRLQNDLIGVNNTIAQKSNVPVGEVVKEEPKEENPQE